MRQADVYLYDRLAGRLTEDETGYTFQYDADYLNESPVRLSVNLPLRKEAFHDKVLFPFFDGLIPEGWLLDIAAKNLEVAEKTAKILSASNRSQLLQKGSLLQFNGKVL